jgi:hypothetical protein
MRKRLEIFEALAEIVNQGLFIGKGDGADGAHPGTDAANGLTTAGVFHPHFAGYLVNGKDPVLAELDTGLAASALLRVDDRCQSHLRPHCCLPPLHRLPSTFPPVTCQH